MYHDVAIIVVVGFGGAGLFRFGQQALGLHRSVVRQVAGMLRRVSLDEPIVFAGGVGRNVCMHSLLEETMEKTIAVPEDPQIVGAYGAGLLAQNT